MAQIMVELQLWFCFGQQFGKFCYMKQPRLGGQTEDVLFFPMLEMCMVEFKWMETHARYNMKSGHARTLRNEEWMLCW